MSNVIQIDREKCIGCGMCAKDCPNKAIKVEDKKATMFLDSCMECGHCLAICPKEAVSMNGYDETEIKSLKDMDLTMTDTQLLDHLKAIRSVRQFKETPVEKEKVEKIIEAGRFTPTGSNAQNIKYFVVENPEEKIEPYARKIFGTGMNLLKKLKKVLPLPEAIDRYEIEPGFFFHHAPAAILVVSDNVVDVGLLSANMGTMAELQGLGLFYVGLFTWAAKFSPSLRKKLGLKKGEKIVTALAVGYPKVKYQRSVPRKKANVTWM